MELNEQIGKNVRNLRLQRRMSINQLAESCALSSVMLAQVEKGTANPTINTIWKIANGLKVPYTALIEPQQAETEIVLPQEDKMQYSPDGKCRIFCYYPVSPLRGYEVFSLEMEAGGEYVSPGHPQDSREYVIVSSGSLQVTVGEQAYLLRAGESLTFSAAVPHCYKNAAAGKTQVFLLNDYDRKG